MPAVKKPAGVPPGAALKPSPPVILAVSNTLHVIPPTGEIIKLKYKDSDLTYKCVPFDQMKELIGKNCHTVEHVSVWWGGRKCHMFVNEDGLYRRLPFNARASGIYSNANLHRAGLDKLCYTDLSKVPDSDMLISAGTLIVGTALLWEGDME